MSIWEHRLWAIPKELGQRFAVMSVVYILNWVRRKCVFTTEGIELIKT